MEKVNSVMRTGVYGIVFHMGKILLITQECGAYLNKLDLPGGGMEFGETIEETLRREFIEELNGSFTSMTHFDNITSLHDVPKSTCKEAHAFHRVGLIYRIDGFTQSLNLSNTLKHGWFDIESITEDNASSFAFKVAQKLMIL